MNTAAALPVLIPLALMIIIIINRSDTMARWTSVVGSLLLLACSVFLFASVRHSGILTLQAGGWRAPFGITLVIDLFSGLMLVAGSVVLVAVSVFSVRFIREDCCNNRFYVFFFSLAMGMNGSLITGDLFNLFVWFEVLLLSSFVLITYGSTPQQLKGGVKYLALNLLGSLFFLAGTGLFYGKTGTLNLAHLAELMRQGEYVASLNAPAILIFVAFGIKAAVFPLHFWLPASYHTPNITITSLFAGLLSKVGVYAMIRVFTLLFMHDQVFWQHLFLVVAGFTMVLGGMAATAQYETRRVLSYHIISQTGYMVMGLGIFTPLGIAGALFFMIHNMLAKTAAFMVAGLIRRVKGSYELMETGGLYRERPFLAILFMVPAFALAGVPPLSGFFAKFILIKAGLEDGHYWITAMAIFTAMLTLFSMIKIWNEAFLKKPPENPFDNKKSPVRLNWMDLFPPAFLGSLSILMGIFARPVFRFTMEAARVLTDVTPYIESVLTGLSP